MTYEPQHEFGTTEIKSTHFTGRWIRQTQMVYALVKSSSDTDETQAEHGSGKQYIDETPKTRGKYSTRQTLTHDKKFRAEIKIKTEHTHSQRTATHYFNVKVNFTY